MTDPVYERLVNRALCHPSRHVVAFAPKVALLLDALRRGGFAYRLNRSNGNKIWIEERWYAEYIHVEKDPPVPSHIRVCDSETWLPVLTLRTWEDIAAFWLNPRIEAAVEKEHAG
jgi:hypothetical protein